MQKKAPKVTLASVARDCGLSITAVSSILNNDPNYKASEQSRKLVHESAARLNYKPNLAARALITRRHHTVGLLFYSIQDRCYSEIMAAVGQELAAHGYAALFAFWGESGFEAALNLLLDHGVDGIISSAPEHHFTGHILDVPLVLYGVNCKGHDAVIVDRGTALRKLLEQLYEAGHRDFAYLGNSELEPRYPEFLNFLEAHQLSVRPGWIHPANNSPAALEAGMKAILARRRRPGVVVMQNDVQAMAAMSQAAAAGVRIPDEMGFIGFDNIGESRYAAAPLTTLDTRIDQSAAWLVELLLNRMKNPLQPVQFRRIEPEIIIRSSVKLSV